MTQHPLQELLDALTLERFSPSIPNDPPREVAPTPAEIVARRRAAMDEVAPLHRQPERRTA